MLDSPWFAWPKWEPFIGHYMVAAPMKVPDSMFSLSINIFCFFLFLDGRSITTELFKVRILALASSMVLKAKECLFSISLCSIFWGDLGEKRF